MRLYTHILATLACIVLPGFASATRFEAMCSSVNETSLPLINIVFDEAELKRDRYIPCLVQIAEYHNTLQSEQTTVEYKATIRHRGGSSTRYEKKSFAIKLRDDNNKPLKKNLFGIRETGNWILDAMAVDRLRMRNRLCFDLWNEISSTPYQTAYGSRNGTNGVFVEVFVNSEYYGLYCLTDKIDRRLLALEKTNGQSPNAALHGFLYKGVAWNGAHGLRQYDYPPSESETWLSYELKYPDGNIYSQYWQPLKDVVDFCSVSTSDRLFKKHWTQYFYEQNVIDYMSFLLALNIGDAPYKNTYLSVRDYSVDKRLLITPWDMDMSLGGNYDGAYLDTLTNTSKLDDIAPYNRLYAKDLCHFRNKLHRRLIALLQTTLSPQHVDSCIGRYSEMFEQSGAWQREVDRWNNNPVPLKADIKEETAYVSEWYRENHFWLLQYAQSQIDKEYRRKNLIYILIVTAVFILLTGVVTGVIIRKRNNKMLIYSKENKL